MCGAKNLGEALRRISEGAAFIRTKGEAGTGNVVEAVRHERAVMSDIRRASAMNDEELYAFAKEIQAPFHLLKETARLKRLPVVNFAAGGIATPGEYSSLFIKMHVIHNFPADAALMMQLGCDGGEHPVNSNNSIFNIFAVFVGSGIFHVSHIAPPHEKIFIIHTSFPVG